MSAALLSALVEIVGPAHCQTGADRGPFVVEGRTPCGVVFPGTAEDAARVVAAASAADVPVIPWGGGTEMGLGAPPRDGALVVSTRRLDRVLEHEPGDLTVTVEAGVTFEALQGALGRQGQWVSLDPPFPGRATLGGVLATDASGPRRYLYGTARDLVIGIRVVGADGALVRAGGKVVKNVAGYDLTKLYIGALGSLGLIVEATLKLRPRPEADRACWATFADVRRAAAAVPAVMGADLVPYAIELLDREAAALCGATFGDAGGAAGGAAGLAGAALLVGFDGLPATVAWQLEAGARLLRDAGAEAVSLLDPATTADTLAVVRDMRGAVAEPLAVAKVGLLPTQVGPYVADTAVVAEAAGLRPVTTAHAGSGILTVILAAPGGGSPAPAATVKALGELRERARAQGGHFLVTWAPLAVKEEIQVWDPPGPAVRLMTRLKAQLDPKGTMNPGRLIGGL